VIYAYKFELKDLVKKQEKLLFVRGEMPVFEKGEVIVLIRLSLIFV
tara:strand:- start:34 stop:171 length:138 start_codon:yes stop_codon:yes gene_type:complete